MLGMRVNPLAASIGRKSNVAQRRIVVGTAGRTTRSTLKRLVQSRTGVTDQSYSRLAILHVGGVDRAIAEVATGTITLGAVYDIMMAGCNVRQVFWLAVV